MSSDNDYSRCWHYLRPNKSSSTPTSFAFVAVDTVAHEDSKIVGHKTHRLDRWSGIAVRLEREKWVRRTEASGENIKGFWEWLYSRLDKKRPLWLWGYRVSYAMQVLSFGTELERGALEWETVEYNLHSDPKKQRKVTWQGVVILEDPPTVIELRHVASGAKLWILDTLNFWRCDHEEFAKTFSGPYSDIVDTSEVPQDGKNPSRVGALPVFHAVTSLVRTIRERDLGNMRWTVSAQGLQCWRHRFMTCRPLIHCHNDSLRLERDSYFGGTVSIYRYGVVKGPIYVLDYQSYYPSIMGERIVPVKWLGYADDRVRCSDLSWLSDFWRIATVTLNTETAIFPVRWRGRLCCCCGEFVTRLQEPELSYALSIGAVTRIHNVAWYTRAVLFKDFVAELWGYRLDALKRGALVEAQLYKMLLNGVPGKFGQRQVAWIDEPTYYATRPWGQEPVLNCDTGKSEILRYLNERVQRQRRLGEPLARDELSRDDPEHALYRQETDGAAYYNESKHSCPQIAGAITSWGRRILEETIDEAGRENVFYCDTDCLHVNQQGMENLKHKGKIRDNTLGQLSIKRVAQLAEYRGVKYYGLDGEWTVSGRKPSATPIIDGQWQQEQYSGWSSLLHDGTCGMYDEYVAEYDRSDEWIPGTVLPDGRVAPTRLALSAEAEVAATTTD